MPASPYNLDETAISTVLPKGVVAFDLIDGVWVAEPRFAIPLAIVLRQSLIEIGASRQAQEGQQTKMELVYQYLTGPRLRHRIDAIVEKFADKCLAATHRFLLSINGPQTPINRSSEGLRIWSRVSSECFGIPLRTRQKSFGQSIKAMQSKHYH
jgi:Uncharacterized protein conserved in bacteria (DUF2130)